MLALSAVPVIGLSLEQGVTAPNGFAGVDKISWTDSRGLLREAYMAKGHPENAASAGYITYFTWKKGDGSTVQCDEDCPGTGCMGISGMCIGIGHNSSEIGWSCSKGNYGEASGHTQRVVFSGSNHLIYESQYSMKCCNWRSNAPWEDGTAKFLMTIHWIFSDGVDHFIWAVTHDCSESYVAPGNPYGDDARSPYMDFDWDGDGNEFNALSGMAWGTNRLTTVPSMNQTNPPNSSWSRQAVGSNTIPFVWEWVTYNDAEAAYVQTQTYNQHQAGGPEEWNPNNSGSSLPDGWMLPYQMNCYQGYWGNKLTWGLPYQAVSGGYGSTSPYQSYSVAVDVGQYTYGRVDDLLTETEDIHNGTVSFSATSGTLVTSGKQGVANPNSHTFSPAGYNHVYRTWEIQSADGSSASFNFNLSTRSYQAPLFVIHNYTASQAPAEVSKNGSALTNGTGFVSSFDDANNKAYVTILGDLSGSNLISVSVGSGTVRRIGELLGKDPLGATSSAVHVYDLSGRHVWTGAASRLSAEATPVGRGAYILTGSERQSGACQKVVW
jgi:hypothetical protein